MIAASWNLCIFVTQNEVNCCCYFSSAELAHSPFLKQSSLSSTSPKSKSGKSPWSLSMENLHRSIFFLVFNSDDTIPWKKKNYEWALNKTISLVGWMSWSIKKCVFSIICIQCRIQMSFGHTIFLRSLSW